MALEADIAATTAFMHEQIPPPPSALQPEAVLPFAPRYGLPRRRWNNLDQALVSESDRERFSWWCACLASLLLCVTCVVIIATCVFVVVADTAAAAGSPAAQNTYRAFVVNNYDSILAICGIVFVIAAFCCCAQILSYYFGSEDAADGGDYAPKRRIAAKYDNALPV